MAARKKHSHAYEPSESGPICACGEFAPDDPELIERVAPKFSDFNGINVPLSAVRMEISQVQKNGLEYMPLSDFLLLVHRCVKENDVN